MWIASGYLVKFGHSHTRCMHKRTNCRMPRRNDIRRLYCQGFSIASPTMPEHVRHRHCYQRALECRRRAFNTGDPLLKADYLAMEDDWLLLARSHELSESISDFSAEVRRFLGKR